MRYLVEKSVKVYSEKPVCSDQHEIPSSQNMIKTRESRGDWMTNG